MRIVYGVHGYGRGHASRTMAVLPHLVARHQVLVLAGGDAYQAMSPEYSVVRIPTLAFAYSKGNKGRRSNWSTFWHNLPAFADLYCHGPTFRFVEEVFHEFAPDVVIADAEAWSSHVARVNKIPHISFDHIGIMAYCRPRMVGLDQFTSWFDIICYRMLMARPERVLVSSFYEAPPRRASTKVVGTLPRAEVRQVQPSDGDHLLMYLNRGRDQFREEAIKTLHELGCPVRIYGTPRRGREGNLTFLPLSNMPFLEDLASCRAVISTAGNQLVGEALFLGKPVLVFPECCAEQRMNAAAVERLGIGMRASLEQFSTTTIQSFLSRLDDFAANIRKNRQDGLPDALAAIDQFLLELAPAMAPTRPTADSKSPQLARVASAATQLAGSNGADGVPTGTPRPK